MFTSLVVVVFFSVGLAQFNLSELSDERLSHIRNSARELWKSVKQSKDPCNDYFEYVCGEKDDSVKTSHGISEIDFKEIIAKLSMNSGEADNAERVMLDYFESCENFQGKSTEFDVQNMFFSIFQLPSVKSNVSEFSSNGYKLEFSRVLGELKRLGINEIFDFSLQNERGKNIVLISSKKSRKIDDLANSYFKFQDVMLRYSNTTKIEEVHKDYVEFEKQYGNVVSSEPRLQVRGNYLLLKALLPDFDWDVYFKVVLGKRLPDNYPLRMNNVDELRRIISNISNMQPRIVINYLFAKFAQQIHNLLSSGTCKDVVLKYFQPVVFEIVKKQYLTLSLQKQFQDIISDFAQTQYLYTGQFNFDFEERFLGLIERVRKTDYLYLTDAILNTENANCKLNTSSYVNNLLMIHRQYTRKRALRFFIQRRDQREDEADAEVRYILMDAVYHSHNQSLTQIFNNIGIPIAVKAVTHLEYNRKYSDHVIECFQKYFKDTTLISRSYFLGFEATKLYFKTFSRFMNKNWEIFEVEDDIFHEFGFSCKKILFMLFIQSTCPFEGTNKIHMKALLSYFWNLDDFFEEYKCERGSGMNPENKCII